MAQSREQNSTGCQSVSPSHDSKNLSFQRRDPARSAVHCVGVPGVWKGLQDHTVDYNPFIKSQLVSRKNLSFQRSEPARSAVHWLRVSGFGFGEKERERDREKDKSKER